MQYVCSQEALKAVDAMQFTIDNQKEVEEWSGGSIRGVALLHHKRHLEVFNPVTDDYQIAEIGSWIVKDPVRGTTVLPDAVFWRLYAVADPNAKFVRLSAAQYNLIGCMEEHAEVIQACSKMLRFGPDFKNPITGIVNKDNLALELYDADLLDSKVKAHGLVGHVTEEYKAEKLRRYLKFTDISRNVANTIE